MAAPEWAIWISPIVSIALGAFGAWARDRTRVERIAATDAEREKHINYRFEEIHKRAGTLETRLGRIEDKPVNGYAGFVERLRQSEEFIDELRQWKDSRGETSHEAVHELRRRVEAVEREIGNNREGIRGWIHKKGNEIHERLGALEEFRREFRRGDGRSKPS
jgi:hypothetical protein